MSQQKYNQEIEPGSVEKFWLFLCALFTAMWAYFARDKKLAAIKESNDEDRLALLKFSDELEKMTVNFHQVKNELEEITVAFHKQLAFTNTLWKLPRFQSAPPVLSRRASCSDIPKLEQGTQSPSSQSQDAEFHHEVRAASVKPS